MKLQKLVAALALVILILSMGLPLSYSTHKVRVIVTVDKRSFERASISRLGGVVVKEYEIIPAVLVELPEHAVKELKKLSGVIRVEHDGVVRALGVGIRGRPQPPQVTPWGIKRIGAPDAWLTTNGFADLDGDGDSEIEVAILDTGVDYDHPDLYANVKWGICVVLDKVSTRPRDWDDRNGHGTHVAGIVAALYNDIGVVGAAHGVELYAIKVLSDSGFGYWSDVIEGIEWALKGPDGVIDSDDDGVIVGDPDDDAAEVISMSLGASSAPEAVHDAISVAYGYNVTLVAAAGNDGAESPSYPAAYEEVIAVGATDENDEVPSWSNRNPELTAPGVDILSTYKAGGYETLSGTSMACPHVSATVALVQAARLANDLPPMPPDELKQLLTRTADDCGDPGYDALYGYGIVRADKAVEEALDSSSG